MLKKLLDFNPDLSALFSIGLLIVLAAWSLDARWAAVYLASSLLCVRLFLNKELWIPKLGFLYYSIYIFAAYGFYLSTKYPGHFYYHLVDWLSFAVVCLVGINHTRMTPIFRVNKWATIICLVYGLIQFYMIPERYPASILVHQNITSQFLGASVILQIASGSVGLLGLTLAHLYFLGCRSIMLGLVVVGIFWIMRKRRVPYRVYKTIFYQFGIAVLAVIILTLSQTGTFTKGTDFKDVPRITGKDVDVRWIRWKNTINMIQDYPFGIGPGNFEWNYVRYAEDDPEHQPRLNIRSPHNGYLELAVEWGIPVACLFIVLMIYLLKNIYIQPLPFSILMLFVVDAMFAFPLELGFSFYIIAFFLGYGMRSTIPGRRVHGKAPRAVLILTLIPILSFGLKSLSAEIWKSTNTLRGVKIACEIKPQDWQACLNYGANLLKRKKYAAANKVFEGILKVRPNMHPAMAMNFKALQGMKDPQGMLRMKNRYRRIIPEGK